MKWQNRGHEFDFLEEKIMNCQYNYYIWGAGTFGKAFCDEFENEMKIVKFVDRNPVKQNTTFCGYDVISPDELKKIFNSEKDIIIVSTGLTKSVYDFLNEMGLKRYVNYFHIDEWSSLYMLYKYNKVYVSDITFGITQFCTLKCEYCNSFIPKIKNPINYSLEEMKETIQTYFQWVDEVNVLALCGGDAMVCPHFDELLQWIVKEYYPRRAKHIEIYSNAVIVPTEMQLEFFKKNKIVYRFTDYSSMTGKQKITEVIELLERYDIMYDHVQFKEWYDCGYPQKSNGISSEQGLINFFDMCDRKTCHGVWNNKIFFCSMCFYADLIKYCELDESDCFDLKKCDEKRKKEFVEYYLGYNEKGYMNYCKMCNGGMNINTHAIPVGNQK